MAFCSLHSPVGDLTLFAEDDALVALEWGWAEGGDDGDEDALLRAARDQLAGYFAGDLKVFTLPLRPAGTAFQLRVWDALRTIAHGDTVSYGALARRLDSAPRAIAGACARNPLPILIPCHRVIARDQGLGGYSGGEGVTTKQALLRLEGAIV